MLVLSSFAGASRGLAKALLVDPFDVGETAAAVIAALDMPRDERRRRMQPTRETALARIRDPERQRWRHFCPIPGEHGPPR